MVDKSKGWQVHVYQTEPRKKKCLFLLPGRGDSGEQMLFEYYHGSKGVLEDVMFVSITPRGKQWYPSPNGPLDQAEAVAGIVPSLEGIAEVISAVKHQFNIVPAQMAFVGFSAGGVMAIHALARLPYAIAGAAIHSGSVLEPNELPLAEARNSIPILSFHNLDDGIFDWENRYLPMKKTLQEKNYQARFVERREGGHKLLENDLEMSSKFIAECLGGGEGLVV